MHSCALGEVFLDALRGALSLTAHLHQAKCMAQATVGIFFGQADGTDDSGQVRQVTLFQGFQSFIWSFRTLHPRKLREDHAFLAKASQPINAGQTRMPE